MDETIIQAHKHSANHRAEIEASPSCGCFYCCEIFPAAEINEWIDDDTTAICPGCGIDSVIGSGSGFPVTTVEFLARMRRYWF